MTQLTDFSAALFDLDGVITDTAPLHFQAWKAIADELDIQFTEADNEHLKGVDRMGSLRFLLSLGQKTLSESDMNRLAEQKNNHYKTLLTSLTEKDILPGVVDLLDALSSENIPIGLASASRNAPAILDAIGLRERFDTIADAGLARSKPEPDIFLFAAYGLKVHPAHCIGFEDALAGLKAIRAAGMKSVSVGEEQLASLSDWHVNSLKDWMTIFD